MKDALSSLDVCDGLFVPTPECYEPESVQTFREWFAADNRIVISAGPFIPQGEQAVANEKLLASKSAETTQFLDSVLASHGKHSLLYVRIRTLYVCTITSLITS